ncbi:hypothetical protein F5Y19DRAFT_483982 [Xylariaceae sp. FL1651]|nr:hypothetical protein F5Y19DRAFT_483982 [Xylariaceae sp. FL1651]
MFTTFSAQMSPVPPTTSTTPPSTGKGKRRKVVRACDSCRLNRIRCDEKNPCENCRNRGAKCTNTMPWEAHSLPAAKREIERLQERLKRLQKRQSNTSHGERRNSAATNESAWSPLDASVSTDPTSFAASKQRISQPIPIAHEPERMTHTHGSPGGSYSDPASSPIMPDPPYLEQGTLLLDKQSESHAGFSQNKERQLISLFWKGYPWLHPILDQDEIDRHHDSLWNEVSSAEQQTRLSSDLVDILLALSMHYGSTFLLRGSSDSSTQTGASRAGNACLAGQSFYQRSRRLRLENPQQVALQSVQYYILSSIYLLNAGSLQLANTALAAGVRIAQILGLHKIPRSDISSGAKQKRLGLNIWSMLTTQDSYLAIMLGLPSIIQPVAEETLMIDIWQSNSYDRPGDALNQSESWEFYRVIHMNLLRAAGSVHDYFLRKQEDLLHQGYGSDLQSSPRILESMAESIVQKLGILRRWADNVPPVMTVSRQGGGGPFSFVRDATHTLDLQGPFHIQQQQLCLEIAYHHLSILLVKPFVRSSHKQQNLPPLKQADTLSVNGLKHAISITSIVHQAFRRGDALTGWLFVFICLWDATLYSLRYIAAYPGSPFVGDTRRSLRTANDTFAAMGKYLEAATSAQKIVHDILEREVARASKDISMDSLNCIQGFDYVNTVASDFISPLSTFMEGSRDSLWDDCTYFSALSTEISHNRSARAAEQNTSEPFDTFGAAPTGVSPNDALDIEDILESNIMGHQDSDDISEAYAWLSGR